MAKNYPYATVRNDAGIGVKNEVDSILEKIGAENVYVSMSKPEVYFQVQRKPFKIAIPTQYFIDRNGGDVKLANRQGWSALRDYLKGLAVMAQLAGEGNEWKAMAQHLQLASGQTAIEEMCERINDMPLALTAGDTESSDT